MTIHRLSAGAGYRYLTRHTASADQARTPETSLTAYYAATGTPPGRWHGTGLAGLAGGAGLAAGTIVDEAAMGALFGSGHDPVAGTPLGRAYPVFRTAAQRAAGRVARLAGSLTREQRATLADQITAEETARPVRAPVAGFDLTFTVPKSVSVLWALAAPGVQAQVVAAHHAAVADTLTFLEDRALFTRVGARSCAQVATRGAVSAGFDHVDTRTGDPNLHTHLVLANKVQGPDGAWRSVDSRALFTAAVALSETYDCLLADHLTTRLGVGWGWRDRGPRRSPAHELTGIPDHLLSVFSTRSAAITTAVTGLVAAHTATTGRAPTRREVLRMRQQATLDTRPDKTTRTLTDQLTGWRARAAAALPHRSPARIVHAALHPDNPQVAPGLATGLATGPARALARGSSPATGVGEAQVADLAGDVLAGLVQRRATWTRWNALAETARQTRHLRCTSAAERIALHDRVVAAALGVCVSVDTPDPFTVPTEYRRTDGVSVFTRAGTDRYTHPLVLAAEERLLDAHADTTAPTLPTDTLDAVDHAGGVPSARAGTGGARVLAGDQVDAVRAAATSGRRVEVLVGPAGSGKTTTLLALRHAWETTHGRGSVIGLAPSAAAARELASALGIGCENTAKWLHETHRPPDPYGRPNPWRLRPGQLVIIDEASLAATATLDALTRQAIDADAKLLLVGDHHQLGPVDAGGAFSLLADHGHPQHLQSLWRFRNRWEAAATRQLRAGDPDSLAVYAAHGRLHDGPHEVMLQAAYQAWTTDTAAGAASLLLAVDTATVAALNERARTDRITTGVVVADGVQTRDGTTIAVGDRVITRRNDRRITLRDGSEYVRNGMLWDVTAVHPDGALTLTPTGPRAGADAGAGAGGVRVPAESAARHVDLGYAVTVHRAQGATVETAHLLTGPGLTREALYVGMTRGRTANHTYITTDPALTDHDRPPGGEPGTAVDVLASVLATVGSEPSATAAIHTQHAAALSSSRLGPIADTLAADLTRRRWTRLLTASSLEPALVEQIQACPQAGALYAALARAETAGHTPARILDHLAAIATDPTGDSEAGVRGLRRRIDTWIDTVPEATLTGPITLRVIGDPDDPAVQPFAAIRDLIDHRLQQRLASHTDPGPGADQGADTAPARRTPDPYSTAANHIPIGGPSR